MYQDRNAHKVPLEGKAPAQEGDEKWLILAEQAYRDSTDWVDASLRHQIEHNLALFQNRHPAGSKYHSEAYKKRSKVFRPKTRAMVRKNEAAAAAAFFSTADLISIEAGNDADSAQQASAQVLDALLDYRLTRTLPWFLLLLGAYQDTMTSGVCISKQVWEFEETTWEVNTPDGEVVKMPKVVKDQPKVSLIPVENFRVDAGADWTDPINSSPYLIHLMPMYAGDVLSRSRRQNPKTGEAPWRQLQLSEILAHGRTEHDSLRAAREGKNRQDSKDQAQGENEFTIVWVREHFMRVGGRDWLYYTLGATLMLSDPIPVEEVYLHGRPFVLGFSVLESHKVFPSGLVELGRDVQALANDIANQRIDNVRLVLNKRYFLRRGANVDLRSLLHNVPGGAVMTDNPNEDVRVVETPDVTSSAYAEQDRINMDFDELTGTFSSSSVASNRKLNETVGGMNILNDGANAITEYQLRVFTETWVEPVLRQLVKLEQFYETDETILALAANKAKLFQRFGIDQITDQLLMQEVTVRVNVGMGSTNPQQKVEKFMFGLQAVAQLPTAPLRLKEDEVIGEVFGSLGYRDGSRFFKSEEEMQELMANQPQPPEDPTLAKAQMDAEIKREQMQLDEGRWQAELEVKREIELAKLALAEGKTLNEIKAKLGLEVIKQRSNRDLALLKEQNKTREMELKTRMGSGI